MMVLVMLCFSFFCSFISLIFNPFHFCWLKFASACPQTIAYWGSQEKLDTLEYTLDLLWTTTFNAFPTDNKTYIKLILNLSIMWRRSRRCSCNIAFNWIAEINSVFKRTRNGKTITLLLFNEVRMRCKMVFCIPAPQWARWYLEETNYGLENV